MLRAGNSAEKVSETANTMSQGSVIQVSRAGNDASFRKRASVIITKTYNITLVKAAEEGAKKQSGTVKRISWRKPGRYFLRTDKPTILSFRGTGPDGNLLLLASGFQDEKTHMRLCFAPVQHAIRTKVLVYIHKGDPPVRPDDISRDEWQPTYSSPVETLLFNVEYTDAECLPRPSISWKRLMDTTKYSYSQLKMMYEQFWYDTVQAGQPGVLTQSSFRFFLGHLGLPNVENEVALHDLWVWFDREENNAIDFEGFVLGLGKSWHDAQFYGLSNKAKEALETERKYAEMDEQDMLAMKQARLNAQLEDVTSAYTRLTGSPIPTSPGSSQRSHPGNSMLRIHESRQDSDHMLFTPVRVRDLKRDDFGGKEPQPDDEGQDGEEADNTVRPLKVSNDPHANINVQQPSPASFQLHSSSPSKDVSTIDHEETDSVYSPERSMKEEEIKTTLQNAVNKILVLGGGSKSPDRSLQKNPLARSFIRACGTSPMTDELIRSFATVFASEIVETSSLFLEADGAPTSPVVPILDISQVTSSKNREPDDVSELSRHEDAPAVRRENTPSIDTEDAADEEATFVAPALQKGNEVDFSVEELSILAEEADENSLFDWEAELEIKVHSANELPVSAESKPFVQIALDDFPNIDGMLSPHSATTFKTPPAEDAIEVRWADGFATFRVFPILKLADMSSKESPTDTLDGLPYYGNAEIVFTVDRGLPKGTLGAGTIGFCTISLADIHANLCRTSDHTEQLKYHGLLHETIPLKARRGLGSDLGDLEISTTITYSRKKQELRSIESNSPKSSRESFRKGIRSNFGQGEFRAAAIKLRRARRASGVKVMDLFRTLDTERKGVIARDTLANAIVKLGADVSFEEARLVFDHFDVHGNGEMRYEDYIEMMMSGGGSEHAVQDPSQLNLQIAKQKEILDEKKRELLHRTNLEAVVDRVRAERKRREILPQTLFDLFDHDNNGSLTKDELKEALKRWNFEHTNDEIDAVYLVYGGEDEAMDYREFLKFITGGSSESGRRVKRAIHPNHRRAGDAQLDNDVSDVEEIEDDEPTDEELGSEEDPNGEEAERKKSKEKARKRFIRQRSLGFATPESSHMVLTVYGAENLLAEKTIPSPQVHLKTAKNGTRYKTHVAQSNANPKWNESFEVGKKGKKGLLGVRQIFVKLKDKASGNIIGSVEIPFNISSFSKSTEVRIKYPLVCHKEQTPSEGGLYGSVDIGIKVIDTSVKAMPVVEKE